VTGVRVVVSVGVVSMSGVMGSVMPVTGSVILLRFVYGRAVVSWVVHCHPAVSGVRVTAVRA
jgi:hypothetical protein